MLMVVSPAKSLCEVQDCLFQTTQPIFADESAKLVKTMQQLDARQLSELMSISDNLAQLNYARYQQWHSSNHLSPAVLMFQGDVYKGLMASELTAKQMQYCQEKLRILSGLYGILRPLDEIQPYRLEMGSPIVNHTGFSLYDFWKLKVTDYLNQYFASSHLKQAYLLNLASNEYFNVVDKHKLAADIITPKFLDWKNGQYKMISFYAKKARGLMARFVIEKQINSADDLQAFNAQGYEFSPLDSTWNIPVFTRKLVADG